MTTYSRVTRRAGLSEPLTQPEGLWELTPHRRCSKQETVLPMVLGSPPWAWGAFAAGSPQRSRSVADQATLTVKIHGVDLVWERVDGGGNQTPAPMFTTRGVVS